MFYLTHFIHIEHYYDDKSFKPRKEKCDQLIIEHNFKKN